jgi:K+-transporting ATPase ATPase C chain
MKTVLPALRIFLFLTVITGVLYPLLVTGIAQGAFSHAANGSLIQRNGKTVGSSLIGQPFDDPKYFWSRPSATTPSYNAQASSGSNQGPTNPALIKAVQDRVASLCKVDPTNSLPVPTDLVTASASGLDPHISVTAAEYQVERVGRVRGMEAERVRDLVRAHTTMPIAGLVGEPVVNVLELNLDLDKQGGQ